MSCWGKLGMVLWIEVSESGFKLMGMLLLRMAMVILAN